MKSIIMKTKPVLNDAFVQIVIDAAVAHAKEQGWAVTIAVADDGGHLLGLRRLDGAAPISAHIAPAKALTAAMGRKASGAFEQMINDGRTAFLSAPYVTGMLTGGVPIEVAGQVIGSVVVSGVQPEQDVAVAQAGIEALKNQL